MTSGEWLEPAWYTVGRLITRTSVVDGIEPPWAKERRWSAALQRAQHAVPLRREWLAGFLAGDVSLKTGRRGGQVDLGEVGLAEECCRADCSPPCTVPVLDQIFIGTMIGSWDAEGKDLRAVFFSDFCILKRKSDPACVKTGC